MVEKIMFAVKVLFLVLCMGLTTAQADNSGVFRAKESSAYTLQSITKEEFENNTDGRVFQNYRLNDDGEIVSQYYHYDINTGKVYGDVLTNHETVSGDGSVANVSVGLALKNSDDGKTVTDTLFRDNQYEYEYTGDGASVFIQGGAVYNEGNLQLENTDFVGNSLTARSETSNIVYVEGGALANKGEINGMSGDFVENAAYGDFVEGGALYNEQSGHIAQVNGAFIGNGGDGANVKGGGIFNMGKIDDISGDFAANKITANIQANGGAIQNNDKNAVIKNINGNFAGNSATGSVQAWGGAIDNAAGTIEHITGNFSNNQAVGNGRNADAIGGAISNQGSIKTVNGSFLGNEATANKGAYGGAVYNDSVISEIRADFAGNAVSGNLEALGGAIYHDSDETLQIVNSNFYNNKAVSARDARGGAVYANKLSVAADGGNSVFRGNTANGQSNALYIDNGALSLSARNGGKLVFDDAIDGEAYEVAISGDNSGEVIVNNQVNGVMNFKSEQNSLLHLGKSAEINTFNYAGNGGVLKLDVEVNQTDNKVNNGIINVSGDVRGKTQVIINSLNTDKLNNDKDAFGLFVRAPNDTVQSDTAFTISRVEGSPYMWQAIRNFQGETGGSNWYYALGGEENEREYAPEIGAYAAMQTAAVEQNRGISDKVSAGLRANRNKGCCDKRFVDRKDAWINADYTYAEIDAPSDMEAKIKGVTAGFDLAVDRNHRFGIFGAYRQGDYSLSGKGDFYSETGSDLDINSYSGGLYYAYEKNKWSLLATVFAGKQDIDIKTDDHIASAKTNAMLYGAGLEAGRKFYLPYAWIIEPSLGLYYTTLDIDGFTDNVGKSVDFDLMHYMEAELGLRVEHLFCIDGWTAKVYAKPSVIRTFTQGDKTRITGLAQTKSEVDKTLGKMEIGAKFGLTPSLSAYTSANYTFGDDYKAYGIDAGVVYAW